MRTGDRVILRGHRWTVLETTAYADCRTVRLARAAGSLVRTFVLPFDRPRAEGWHGTSVRVVRPRRALHHLRRAAVRLHPFGGLVVAASSSIDLLPYQLAPALAVLRHGWARVLIADDAGLGKTIQAGLIAAELRARSASTRILILAPAGLRSQWAAEMEAHFNVGVTSADASWLRATANERPAGANPWTLPQVYLASHDFVKRPEVLRPLEEAWWDLLIVDEAHGVTVGTDRRAAIDALASRALCVVLLTATPHDADRPQQTALTRIGATASNTPWIAFRRARWMVAPGPERRSRIVLARPTEDERRMHRLLEDYTRRVWREATARGDPDARLASIILCKRALSSAGSLAVSVRRRMELLSERPAPSALQISLPLDDDDLIEDAEPVSALAAPGLTDTRLEVRWLAAILEIARHASLHESKLQRLLELLGRLDEPALVFTEYRDTLARVRSGLAGRGIHAAILHGGMRLAERHAAQQALNTSARVLLATDAAAEGLNLQARCRIVIHYELPWNPSRLEQRAGRVDRIGQQRRVHEMALVADDTAERLVLEPIARRCAQARVAHRPRLFHALAESRTAAAVLGDQAAEAAGANPADDLVEHDSGLLVPGLDDEARAETERLQRHRAWIAQSGVRDVDFGVPNATALCGKGGYRSVAFVYRLSIHTGDGSVQHSELVVLRADGVSGRLSGSAQSVRSEARQIRDQFEQEIGFQLTRIAAERVEETSVALSTLVERRSTRERAIAETTASAARRLVQRRLFDRPSRQPESGPATAPAPAPLQCPIPPLFHSSIPPLLHSSIDLIAVLLWP